MSTYLCRYCKNECDEIDVLHELVFTGNQEEPPEYQDKCPHCGSTNIDEIEMMECPYCKEISLPETGGECTECHAEVLI